MIPIPKDWNWGEAARKPKQDLNPAEEALHHAAPCLPSAAHDKIIRMPRAHGPMSASALECLHPILFTLLEKQPRVLASPASWSFHCNLALLSQLHSMALQGAGNPPQWSSLTAFWNLEQIYDPLINLSTSCFHFSSLQNQCRVDSFLKFSRQLMM